MRHGHTVGHNRRVQYQTAGPAVLGGDVAARFVRINGLCPSPAFSLIDILIVQSMLLNYISHLAFIVLLNA